jgi:hypothetical protein
LAAPVTVNTMLPSKPLVGQRLQWPQPWVTALATVEEVEAKDDDGSQALGAGMAAVIAVAPSARGPAKARPGRG